MDYENHYRTLIERARNRTLDCYSENHHVIPKCMGGTDDPENIVSLTAEEHYVAHQLLVKIHPDHSGLVFAAIQMTGDTRTHQRNSNKLYGWLKRRQSKAAKSRIGSKNGSYSSSWYYNPRTRVSTRFYKDDVPIGWLKGRLVSDDAIKPNIRKYTCVVCHGKFEHDNPKKYCSKKCRSIGMRKKRSKLFGKEMEFLKWYRILKSSNKALRKLGIPYGARGSAGVWAKRVLEENGVFDDPNFMNIPSTNKYKKH